ncbi:MAG: tetratricopeptide repeat protein [Steroidobacteraceae bacterium]|nr:tetratricopeptide repeat protein [Steroidobacteraceae bacterium]
MDPRLQDIAGLLQAGRTREAEIACRALLAARPADAAALNLLGVALRHSDRLDESEVALRRAVEYSGGNPDFRSNLAQLLRARGRHEAAMAEFRRALEAAPRLRQARLGLARTALEAGQPALAEREARTLTAADARDREAWSALGSALYAQSRPEQAAAALRRAVALDPDYAVARENLAIVLGVLDKSEEALAELAQCERLGRGGPALEMARARALMQLDRYGESEAALEGVLAQAPDDRDAHFLLAQLRHIRGDPDFTRSLRAAAERAGAPAATRALYGDLLRRTGKVADAEAVLRGLIASVGPQPQLLSSLATVLQESARYAESVPLARAAWEAQPDDASFAENLVANLVAAGDAMAALPIVERFHASAPADQRWITYRADIARQSGEALFSEWCDVGRLVGVYELEPPSGYRTIAEFHEELIPALESRHRHAAHPLDQSLRGGTQTSRGLLADPDPVIQRYLAQLAQPIAAYQAGIGRDAAHPMLSRNVAPARPVGCWSVRLKRGGFHVNHIHPEGWISSAYYVSVPAEVSDLDAQSGWIKFAEPRYPMPGGTPLRTVQPQAGRLVLFPSYLWHGTNPILGDEPRLTVAFDCRPEG